MASLQAKCWSCKKLFDLILHVSIIERWKGIGNLTLALKCTHCGVTNTIPKGQ